MSSSQTVLEWSYKPTYYFEEPVVLSFSGGEIKIAEGKVRGEFDAAFYGESRSFRDAAHEFLLSIFLAQQVQAQETFTLILPSMAREHSDGSRDVTTFPESASATILVGKIDTRHTSKDGIVLSDTRAERLGRQAIFRDRVVKLFPSDVTLKRMLQSYNNALADKDNFFIHLDEIRQALASRIGKDGAVCEFVGVSVANWRRFGNLANNQPLLEGRHRGEHQDLRKATKEEITWALEFGQSLIEGYVNTQSTNSST